MEECNLFFERWARHNNHFRGRKGKQMTITFSDNLGMIDVTVDDSGITCDGYFVFFTDTNGRDYKIPFTNVFSIIVNQ